MHRTSLATVLAGLAAASILTAAQSPVAAEPSATHVTSIPRVGALFFPSVLALPQLLPLPHECSGSVVRSATHDVVLTAAHCVVGTGLGYQFAPGYHDGVFPFGLWTVLRVYVDPAWRTGHDPQHDYAFLTVAPRTIGGASRQIEEVVGGYSLGTAPAAGQPVTVDGYLSGVRDEPLTCTAPTYRTTGFPSIDCDGFTGGTSGGPWLVGDSVVGVIGGLHQGGCLAATSYSAAFGADAAMSLQRADTGARGDVVGLPGSDGC